MPRADAGSRDVDRLADRRHRRHVDGARLRLLAAGGGADFPRRSARLPHRSGGRATPVVALFGIFMIIVGQSVQVEGEGTGMLIVLSDRLGEELGPVGKWLFLIGTIGTVFSSLLGVWQAHAVSVRRMLAARRAARCQARRHARADLSAGSCSCSRSCRCSACSRASAKCRGFILSSARIFFRRSRSC